MIEQRAKRLIVKALEQNISDIHITPLKEKYCIFFRYAGRLLTIETIKTEIAERLITYFKYISGMEIGEKRKPQSGSCQYQAQQHTLELRTSTISNFMLKESLVIRLLKVHGFKQDIAAYFPTQVKQLYQLLKSKQGLVIFSGPVDSGKTTTIYQLLADKYQKEQVSIITLEDPVEITNEYFLQTEINPLVNIDYDTLIKASLRHHPDILVVGEIRDENTAKMAIRAALTGHLVIATIHAKSCLGVLYRLQDLGVSATQLKETLLSIVSQRLLPRYCALCQDNCQLYCRHLAVTEKRLALFHIMTRQALYAYWQNEQSIGQSMNDMLCKAYIYGYITRLVLEEHWLYV